MLHAQRYRWPFAVTAMLASVIALMAPSPALAEYQPSRYDTLTHVATYQSNSGSYPEAVAVDALGRYYLTDSDYNEPGVPSSYDNWVRGFTTSGSSVFAFGAPNQGTLMHPSAIDFLSNGDVVIADSGHDRVVVVDPISGEIQSVLGQDDPENPEVSFPGGLVVAPDDTIWVASTFGSEFVQYTASGTRLSSFHVDGWVEGEVSPMPESVTIDAQGRLWSAFPNENYVQCYATDGTLVQTLRTWTVTNDSGNPIGMDELAGPRDVEFDPWGTMYVADTSDSRRLVRFSATGEWLGTINPSGALLGVSDIDIDAQGTIWAADPTDDDIKRFALTKFNDHHFPTTSSNIPGGWRSSDVTVTLSVIDSGLDVAQTYYSVDGGNPTIVYTGPFVVSAEGTTTVSFYSVDMNADAESVVTQQVRIDKSAPIITTDHQAHYSVPSTITISAADALSGVSTVEYSLDGGLWTSGRYVPSGSAGTHVLRVRSSDAVGNTTQIEQSYEVFTRVEQTDPRVVMTGAAWLSAANTGRSGGDWTYSKTGPAVVYADFTGTRIDLIASLAPTYGRARVYIDGNDHGTVDFYDRSYLHQQRLTLASGLSAGPHTLRLEWTGTKNPASSDYTIGVDALEATSITQHTEYIEDASTLTARTAGWTTVQAQGRSGGSFSYVNQYGAMFCTSFKGSGFDLIASKNPDYGIARISIDGGAPVLVDLYSGSYLNQQRVFSVRGLGTGDHTAQIEWTGTKNPASTGTRINVDAFETFGPFKQAALPATALTRYENASPLLAYGGDWLASSATGRSAGNWHYADGAGAAAYIEFTGTRFDLIGSKAPSYGMARVTVDGGVPVLIDCFSTSFLNQQQLYSIGGLSAGDHSVLVEWTGSKHALSTGTRINIDAVDVSGTLRQAYAPLPPRTRYENTSPLLAFDGEWAHAAASGRSASNWSYADTDRSRAFVRFNGTAFDLIASKSPSLGIARVTVDGGAPQTVDLYSPDYVNQSRALCIQGLSSGDHVVMIEWTGTKNPSSSGTRINIDAVGLETTGTLLQAQVPASGMTRFETEDGRISAGPGWTHAAAAGRSSSTWSYSDTELGVMTIRFSGTACDVIASKSPVSGIAAVSVDGADPTMVDLYDRSYLNQKPVLSLSGLSDTVHTITITWTGSKNAASGSTRVNVDAIDVLGTLEAAP